MDPDKEAEEILGAKDESGAGWQAVLARVLTAVKDTLSGLSSWYRAQEWWVKAGIPAALGLLLVTWAMLSLGASTSRAKTLEVSVAPPVVQPPTEVAETPWRATEYRDLVLPDVPTMVRDGAPLPAFPPLQRWEADDFVRYVPDPLAALRLRLRETNREALQKLLKEYTDNSDH